MQAYRSQVQTASEQYRENYAAMSALCDQLKERLQEQQWPGSDGAVRRHVAAGCLLARERIEMLLDQVRRTVVAFALAGGLLSSLTATRPATTVDLYPVLPAGFAIP